MPKVKRTSEIGCRTATHDPIPTSQSPGDLIARRKKSRRKHDRSYEVAVTEALPALSSSTKLCVG